MKRKGVDVKKIYLQILGTVDQGRQLELIQADENENEIENSPYPLATFLADNNENIVFEIYPEEGTFRIPIEELEKAIEVAKEEVRSENYFSKD